MRSTVSCWTIFVACTASLLAISATGCSSIPKLSLPSLPTPSWMSWNKKKDQLPPPYASLGKPSNKKGTAYNEAPKFDGGSAPAIAANQDAGRSAAQYPSTGLDAYTPPSTGRPSESVASRDSRGAHPWQQNPTATSPRRGGSSPAYGGVDENRGYDPSRYARDHEPLRQNDRIASRSPASNDYRSTRNSDPRRDTYNSSTRSEPRTHENYNYNPPRSTSTGGNWGTASSSNSYKRDDRAGRDAYRESPATYEAPNCRSDAPGRYRASSAGKADDRYQASPAAWDRENTSNDRGAPYGGSSTNSYKSAPPAYPNTRAGDGYGATRETTAPAPYVSSKGSNATSTAAPVSYDQPITRRAAPSYSPGSTSTTTDNLGAN